MPVRSCIGGKGAPLRGNGGGGLTLGVAGGKPAASGAGRNAAGIGPGSGGSPG